ncbi:MAG: 50S ribosomal protein L25 [Candidatus Terrybacteria bacterium]|nr:50S ribosomal protein L25 [Candidatus Terrybacteria bacterium]
MTLQLQAEKRDVFGKKLKMARREGKLSAILYGKKMEPTPLFVDLKEFNKIWKKAGESTIIKLESEGKKIADVLIYDVAVDSLKREPVHADFYAMEMDKPITAKVPLVFEGIAPAVKELGSILVKVIHEVEVEALPKNLPHELKIDLARLATLDDKILIKDIVLPPGVKILSKKDEIVALAETPKEEIEEKPISIEEVEVEKKGKKPVEGEAGEEISKS